jgi:hypothetical protein
MLGGKFRCVPFLLLLLVATSFHTLDALTYTLHAIGGATSQASSYKEDRLPRAGDSILVTGPMLWDAPLPRGIHNIVLNGTNASWQIAPYVSNLSVYFGSTGIDAVGAACGGTVGNPGDCATMFGFTVLRAANPCLNLTTPARTSSTVLGTVDNVSPIYIRFQPMAGCAKLTLKNVVITNLGGDSSHSEAYSGIVFMPCCSAVNAIVDVENVQVLNYYRLFLGGAAWTDSNSSFKWYAVTSYGSRSRTYGAITISGPGFDTLQVYDATDSKPQADGYYFYTFGVGSAIDIQRPFVAGSTQWKRGAYFDAGNLPGSGSNILRDAFCLNYKGSRGSESCMYDGGGNQYGTSVYGMVSTGNYETLALRPGGWAGSYRGANPEWSNFWLSEDGTVARDQGVVFIGGGLPHVHHGVVVLTGPGGSQMAVFAYAGAQPSWDHLTIVGLNTQQNSPSLGMLFGESGFVVKNADGNSNIVMGLDVGILDCNDKVRGCRGTTYRIDPHVGAGVHHNDVWNADSGWSYFYTGGAGFENVTLTPHPDPSYGDLTVNPYLTDTSRNPFTFDRTQLNGDGTGSKLIALAASRWRLPVGTLNPTQAALRYLLQGFTPMSGNAVCTGGYQGTQMGAVPCM